VVACGILPTAPKGREHLVETLLRARLEFEFLPATKGFSLFGSLAKDK
jgi:hypothetical protein